jgi:RNA polymerase sigma-70 factor (ECF subfamily)
MNASVDETSFLNFLRAGDEAAFTRLVEQFHPSLVRLARLFVREETIAEELAQETWLAVLQGLNHFEGRSSLKTWIFTILTNKAKTRAQREKRTLALTDLEEELHAARQPAVDPERFNASGPEGDVNHWVWGTRPTSWAGIPEESLLSEEVTDLIRRTIETLPENQRAVITLRDVQELPAAEVCNVLGVSESNQRVLLHRARARVRQALEQYLQAND